MSTPAATRRQMALGPVLRRLEKLYGQQGQLSVPESLNVGGQTLPLDDWERTILGDSGSETPEHPWAPLVSEGVAFQVKALGYLSPEAAPDSEPEALTLDIAVGLALLEETQRVVNDLIRVGEMRTAKRWSGFRNKIAHTVAQLKDRIDEEIFESAQLRATAMMEALDEPAGKPRANGGAAPAGMTLDRRSSPSLPPVKRAAKPDRVRPTESLDEERVSLTKPFGILLVVLALVWAVFFMPRFFREEAHVITHGELTHIAGVKSMKAKPPSLFVVVEGQTWDAMSSTERVGLLDQLGQVAGERGYHGAHVTREDGTTVGQWMASRGSRVMD